ncbi:magnesium transporter CorA family protein [Macrococcus equipercicus]|uniref:Magnesium transporter CorA n=1 Tax=Macrococcus equipercicus TaxID=69967 RepID=A0A9Q9BN95_9STAP|nr:magnesium transporter CorA family protein [Macrococcus equipercicus]KAA1039344.1 magnesium transporter CorA [Macrococcus equipercicus]UTH13635.1 magnesium transporter CorA family protein [Macrococcus equipercicus]
METIYRYSKGSWEKFFIEAEQIKPHAQSWTARFADLESFDRNIVKIDSEEDFSDMWGYYVYYQSLEEEHDNQAFKFYLSAEELILINLDVARLMNTTDEELLVDYSRRSPIDNFMVILKHATSTYMAQIDRFEDVLHDILWEVKERNNINIMDAVAKADHQLLLCKTQVVTITEIFMVVQEAFCSELQDNKYFNQLKLRLERAKFLIDSYEQEIDALLDFENLVSSYRGNEISKTLTVFTTLFAPATVLGAIWGMNFKNMPELDWKYGYLIALLSIMAVTLAVYFYLKGKGWTGDLLDTKKRRKFF